MVFVRPTLLWLLLALIPIALLHIRHRTGLRPGRTVLVAAMRTLALALVVVAMARPLIVDDDPRRTVVVVADVSGSLTDAERDAMHGRIEAALAARNPDEIWKLVTFDRRARAIDLPGTTLPADAWRHGIAIAPTAAAPGTPAGASDAANKALDATAAATPGSALADALELAGALISHDGRGRILLYSDGLQTDGDAEAVALRLARRGLPVTATNVGAPRRREVALRAVDVPAAARIGETVTVRAEIDAAQASPARVVARDADGTEIVAETTLRPGLQSVALRWPLAKPADLRLDVSVNANADTLHDNDTLPAAVRVRPPLRVAVVEADADAPATAAMAAWLGPAATVKQVTPEQLANVDPAANTDVLVLGDVPAEALAPIAARLRDAVVSGLGLLVTGGRRALSPGGYADSPLAECLPVRFDQTLERRDPSTTLVVIIDTSGSMGGPRVNLAKEIARLAMARLKPHDKVGIVEFYGSKRWAAPIQPASNAIDLQRALNRLTAGGGTVILPAIEEAYYALRNVQTRTKHVLVLTDGGVESGAFEPLIRAMADQGITLSTVMVGPGAHSAFLTRLANWGRGRFYAAPDRFRLPEVIIKQPESSRLWPVVEQPVSLVRRLDDPIIADIDWNTAPPVQGYVQTVARPTADVLIETAGGDPILARWQYGLGRVAVLTTHAGGDWSAALGSWPPFARVASNLTRAVAGPDADTALRIRPIRRPGAIELAIDNQLALGGDDAGAIEVVLTDDTGASRRWTIDPTRPDQWNLRLDDLTPGVWRIDAQTTDGTLRGTANVAVAPVREVDAVAPDRQLLARLNARQDEARRAAAEIAIRATRPRELWPYFAAAALPLILLMVLVRRWPPRERASSDAASRRAASAVPAVIVLLAAIVCAHPVRAATDTAASTVATTPTTSAPSLPPLAKEAIERALTAADETSMHDALATACRLVLERDGQLDALSAYLARCDGPPERVARLVARTAMLHGDLASARTALAALATAPTAGAATLAELGRVQELLGNDEAALAALADALARNPTPAEALAIRIRQVSMLYDAGHADDAANALRSMAGVGAVATGDDAAGGANAMARFRAYLAALSGDNRTAIELLGGVPESSAREPDAAEPAGATGGVSPEARAAKVHYHNCLLDGLLHLRLGQPDQAEHAFELAYAAATSTRDRQYALERIIASARDANRLGALADAWLANPTLSADRLSALVAVLRELGRADDALKLLATAPAAVTTSPTSTGPSDEWREALGSPALQRELIAVAVEAGRTEAAEAAYLHLLQQHPDEPEYRVGLARLRLLDGRRDEAIALFTSAIDATNDPRRLMALADGARTLALDEPALAAARKAAQAGPAQHVRAVIFEADLARQRGQTDSAMALLRDLAAEPQATTDTLLQAAEAFERAGDRAQALDLFRQLYERTHAEDVLLRIAWLLEENERYVEALELWEDLWRTTNVEARRQQAQERVLDLASQTGRLADLAIDLEERLDDGRGGERELALLVELYTHANDAVSAAEILQEYGHHSGRQVDMLQRLARVYLSCEQFGRCNATLRQLAALDPANAPDYLQQIAIVALERHQPQQARAALAELEAATGGGDVVDEFAAGVLDLIGLHAEAAQAYGRVLARHPDRIESFLLWGNAKKAAGRADQAIARFQVLVEEAEEDDLFAVAIDGLLNLDAPPVALRSALRRVRARIAAAPEKVFLYRLASDLLEAMNRNADAADVIELSVLVAGERRGPILRELMDAAHADGRQDRLIRFGRSLLALGEEVPPSVYLDLGEALVRQGDLTLAEHVFERASLEGDFTAIRQRVAGYYEQANLPDRADRIIRELLITRPDDVPLLIRSGGLAEQVGDFDRAFAQYYHAADRMLSRLPSVIRADEAGAAPTSGGATGASVRSRRAADLDEISQYFDAAGGGLLNAARTPAVRERLLADVTQRVEEEIASLDKQRRFAPAIARNPRLERLSAFLRQIAFSLHAPDIADRIDRELIEHYPRDARVRTAIMQARMDWGLDARAAAFVAPGDQGAPPALTLRALLTESATLEARLTRGGIEPALAQRLIPALILTGRDDEARRALRAVATPRPELMPQVVPAFIAAAIALDDHDAVKTWANAWFDACARLRTPRATAVAVERCIRFVWNHVDEPTRAELVSRMQSMAATADEADRLSLDLLRLRFAEVSGTRPDDFDHIVAAMVESTTVGSEVLVRLLEETPAERRPALLQQMTAARPPDARRGFLLGVLAQLDVPADEALTQAFETLFTAAPKQRIEGDRAYTTVLSSRWYRNAKQAEPARRIAEVLLTEAPNVPAVLVAAALARQTAGRHDEAMLLIREMLDARLAVREPTFDDRRVLDDIVPVLTPADVDAALSELDDREAIDGATPMTGFARALLLDAVGRSDESIAAMRAAFEASPANPVISRRLIAMLKESGRRVELAEWLSANLTKATIMESYEWRTLSETWCQLYAPLAAIRAAQRDESPLAPVMMMRIYHMMGRDDQLRIVLRRFLAQGRKEDRLYSPFWPAPLTPGGLIDSLAERDDRLANRPRLFVAMADRPFAVDEYRAVLLALSPTRRELAGLVEGLVSASRTDAQRRALLDPLLDANRRNAMTAGDRRLLVAVAAQDATAVPLELFPVIDELLRSTDPSDTETLAALARVARMRGDVQREQAILRWIVANDLVEARSNYRVADLFDRMDTYVSSLPSAERDATRRRLLDALAPGPLDPLADTFDAARLQRWMATAEAQTVEPIMNATIARLGRERSRGRYPALYAVIAQWHAQGGRLDAFGEAVDAAFDASVSQSVSSAQVPVDRFLPVSESATSRPSDRADTLGPCVDRVAKAIHERLADARLTRAAATHALCLLGQACVKNGMRDQAVELVQDARSIAGPLGDHWLWIADVARMAGAEDDAVTVELSLAEADRLPIARVPALLKAVESRQGRDAADRLAERIAHYSDEPAVLERLIARARRQGDADAERTFTQRLRAATGQPPA